MGYWHRPPKNEYQSGSSRTIKVQAERPEALKHSSSVLYVIPQNQWRPGGAKVSPFPYMDLPELAPPLRSPQHSAAASIVHHFHILSHCEWPKGTKSVNSKFIVSYVFFKKQPQPLCVGKPEGGDESLTMAKHSSALGVNVHLSVWLLHNN